MKILFLDLWVNTHIPLLWSSPLNKVMIFITNIASPENLSLLAILVFGILIIRQKWHKALFLFTTMFTGVLAETGLKHLIERARPLNSLIEAHGFSFPSGHATMSAVFFLSLIFLFKDNIQNPLQRSVFIIGSVLLFLLIGFSRIYLNVHWTSDVVAGIILGITIVYLAKLSILNTQQNEK